jgi:hypothetical protein
MPHSMLLSPASSPVSRAPRAWGVRRLLQTVAALGLAALAGVVSASGATGCGSTSTFCAGGFIRPTPGTAQGVCEGLCAPSKCANPGNVCVDNRCELECAGILDCQGGQDCVAAKTDGASGTAVTICQTSSKAAIGARCPFGNECAAQKACPDGSNCDYTQCGGTTCSPDPVACDGVTGCTTGKCSDGSACVVPGCAQTACKPLVCVSNGSGDADAYCSLQDCQTDANCPGGYWCEVVSDPHQICGKPKPNTTTCGTTTDPCVDPSMNAANGTTYSQGQFCTERNECRIRRQCDPCATDVDCSLTPSQHCVAGSCALDCGSDADCLSGYQCTSGECVPRYGSCAAPKGTGTFCETCRNQDDCATGFHCDALLPGGLRTCLISAGTKNCTADSMCPKSPSGLFGACLGAAEESQPGDGVYQTCFAPFDAAGGAYQCWCSNKAAACYTSADCCSKSCKGADEANGVTGACD